MQFGIPSASGSLVLKQTKGATDNKGNNSANVLSNSVKSQSDYLNIDPNSYSKYGNPNSSGIQGIVLTLFFYCFNGRVEKGA